MSDGNGQQIAAGWYPDPAGSGGQRWWDGHGWTNHLAPAVQPAASPQPHAQPAPFAPQPAVGGAAVSTSTVWVWLMIFLPLISLVALFLWDFPGYMERAMTQPSAVFASMLDPGYLLIMVLSWLIYGLSVWFSYLDYAALGRIGVQRRFHWAWTFLSSLVYVIGRTVMVRRHTGGPGAAPMWAAIAMTIFSVLVAVGWSIWVMVVVMDMVQSSIAGYSSY